MADILPCPFCGGDAELRESITDAMVACNICGCRTGFVYLGANEGSNGARKLEAISIWNARDTGDLPEDKGTLAQIDIDGAIEAARITGWDGVAKRLEQGWRPEPGTREHDLILSYQVRRGVGIVPAVDEIDWKAVAHRAAGHIDALLLYATAYPKDSHPCAANKFLIDLRRELDMAGPHRTQPQWADKGFHMPLPRLSTPTDKGPHHG